MREKTEKKKYPIQRPTTRCLFTKTNVAAIDVFDFFHDYRLYVPLNVARFTTIPFPPSNTRHNTRNNNIMYFLATIDTQVSSMDFYFILLFLFRATRANVYYFFFFLLSDFHPIVFLVGGDRFVSLGTILYLLCGRRRGPRSEIPLYILTHCRNIKATDLDYITVRKILLYTFRSFAGVRLGAVFKKPPRRRGFELLLPQSKNENK